MEDGVGLADVGEELVAEALAFRRAAHQARDVDHFQIGEDDLLALRELGERGEARVDDRHDADVRLDRAERIVRALRARGGECVEDRRFADVRQSDDTYGQSHDAALNRRGASAIPEAASPFRRRPSIPLPDSRSRRPGSFRAAARIVLCE